MVSLHDIEARTSLSSHTLNYGPPLESGLIVFKLIEGDLSHSNCNLEVVMDDMRFPSYVSSKAKTRHVQFDESEFSHIRRWVSR